MPPIYKVITGKEIIAVPEYYDYQRKARWYLGDIVTLNGVTSKHALSMFVFGSYDTFKLVRKLADQEKKDRVEQGANSAAGNLTVFNDISSHSRSLAYDYLPGRGVKLRTLLFNTLIFSRFYREAPGSSLGIIDVNTQPNITGLREIFDMYYWDRKGRFRAVADYQLFYFNSSGTTQQIKAGIPAGQAALKPVSSLPITSKAKKRYTAALRSNRNLVLMSLRSRRFTTAYLT